MYDSQVYQECTFSPRINQISDKIISFKRGENNKNYQIHETLFNEHKDRTIRMKKLENETLMKDCSFRPNLELSNKFSSPVTSTKDFYARNVDYRRHKELRQKTRL